MPVTVKEEEYGKYGKVLRLSNGKVNMAISTDVGPRIISFSIEEGPNVLNDDAYPKVQHNYGEWKLYGGHRLWHSPEANPRSYMPDNDPVPYEVQKENVIFTPKVEPYTQIQKQVQITLGKGKSARVVHKLINKNAWPVEMAAWAITVCAKSGTLIVPMPERDTGLLSNRVIQLWPYSKAGDERLLMTEHFILLKHDPSTKTPLKFGINNEQGWMACLANGQLFVKKFTHIIGAGYPDNGASSEVYATDWGLEAGTLSPLQSVPPDGEITHEEEWFIEKCEGLSPANPEMVAEEVAKMKSTKENKD